MGVKFKLLFLFTFFSLFLFFSGTLDAVACNENSCSKGSCCVHSAFSQSVECSTSSNFATSCSNSISVNIPFGQQVTFSIFNCRKTSDYRSTDSWENFRFYGSNSVNIDCSHIGSSGSKTFFIPEGNYILSVEGNLLPRPSVLIRYLTPVCIKETFDCTSWSKCSSSFTQKTRTCTSSCGNSFIEKQDCPVCENECSIVGESVCVGEKYKSCLSDSNGCLVFSSLKSCSSGTSCVSGKCVKSNNKINETKIQPSNVTQNDKLIDIVEDPFVPTFENQGVYFNIASLGNVSKFVEENSFLITPNLTEAKNVALIYDRPLLVFAGITTTCGLSTSLKNQIYKDQNFLSYISNNKIVVYDALFSPTEEINRYPKATTNREDIQIVDENLTRFSVNRVYLWIKTKYNQKINGLHSPSCVGASQIQSYVYLYKVLDNDGPSIDSIWENIITSTKIPSFFALQPFYQKALYNNADPGEISFIGTKNQTELLFVNQVGNPYNGTYAYFNYPSPTVCNQERGLVNGIKVVTSSSSANPSADFSGQSVIYDFKNLGNILDSFFPNQYWDSINKINFSLYQDSLIKEEEVFENVSLVDDEYSSVNSSLNNGAKIDSSNGEEDVENPISKKVVGSKTISDSNLETIGSGDFANDEVNSLDKNRFYKVRLKGPSVIELTLNHECYDYDLMAPDVFLLDHSRKTIKTFFAKRCGMFEKYEISTGGDFYLNVFFDTFSVNTSYHLELRHSCIENATSDSSLEKCLNGKWVSLNEPLVLNNSFSNLSIDDNVSNENSTIFVNFSNEYDLGILPKNDSINSTSSDLLSEDNSQSNYSLNDSSEILSNIINGSSAKSTLSDSSSSVQEVSNNNSFLIENDGGLDYADIPNEENKNGGHDWITSATCSGCYFNKKCYSIGYRTSGNYCSDSLSFVSQKGSEEVCENSFECISNFCAEGSCIDKGLLTKILDFFKKF